MNIEWNEDKVNIELLENDAIRIMCAISFLSNELQKRLDDCEFGPPDVSTYGRRWMEKLIKLSEELCLAYDKWEKNQKENWVKCGFIVKDGEIGLERIEEK